MATNSIAISKDVGAISSWQGAVVVLGRFLFALIFLMAGANHFNKQTIGYAASQGVPLAAIAVPLSGVLAIAGGLSILLGYRAKLGAWLIVLFLVPVSLMMHKFWTVTDPMMAQIQMILSMKKCFHARRRPADFSVRSRTVQPGCPPLALNAPNKRREPNAQSI
jgi:putative oxidoreductase